MTSSSETVNYRRGLYIPTAPLGTYFLAELTLHRGAKFLTETGLSLIIGKFENHVESLFKSA